MSETPVTSKMTSSTPSSTAADQARIRKERREAKIRAGSTARLNRITGLNKEQQESEKPNQNITSTPPFSEPEEVDNLNHTYKDKNTGSSSRNDIHFPIAPASVNSTASNEEALREMMRQLSSFSDVAPSNLMDNNPFNMANQSGISHIDNGSARTPPTLNDPMIKIMQQIMGESLHNGEGERNVPDLTNNQEKTTTASPYGYIWRYIHAVWAIAFGVYIAVVTQFTGTESERERSIMGFGKTDDNLLLFASSPQNFFYLFITIEAVLLGSRYFLDREDTKPSGILGMLLGTLQEPIRGYVQLSFRYMNIWTTISRDATICIFILGAFAWWKS